MCIFSLYISHLPLSSQQASIAMWTILITKSWWWLLKPKRSTTTLHHNKFTYLDYVFLFPCSPMARETWVQSQVESYQRLKKWYLMPPCLTLSIVRYGSRVKWSNPGKGVAPSPIPWCSSYRKGSLRVTLDYGCKLYLLIYIYMEENNG